MKCDKHTMLLYAVTDRAWVGEQTLYQQVESALKGGATCVQLREKHLDDADFLQEAIEIHALCQQYGVPLFINDNVDVAVKCHAEGIHVGQDDMAAAQVRQRVGEDMMIGVSAHIGLLAQFCQMLCLHFINIHKRDQSDHTKQKYRKNQSSFHGKTCPFQKGAQGCLSRKWFPAHRGKQKKPSRRAPFSFLIQSVYLIFIFFFFLKKHPCTPLFLFICILSCDCKCFLVICFYICRSFQGNNTVIHPKSRSFPFFADRTFNHIHSSYHLFLLSLGNKKHTQIIFIGHSPFRVFPRCVQMIQNVRQVA